MSGTIVRSLDHLVDATLASVDQNNQVIFTIFYRFLQQHVTAGNAVLYASNFGSGGTGFDFYDGANPSGENAFAVFRFLASASTARTKDFYVMIQWADTSAFGASPGAPGRIGGGILDGVGIVMAYRDDGTSPWAGGTAAAGADTKGATVWTAGGSTVHVLNRTCSALTGATSGSYVTNKEDTVQIYDISGTASTSSVFIHLVGDADTIFWSVGSQSSGLNGGFGILGSYIPIPSLTISAPFFSAANSNLGSSAPGASFTTIYGTTAGSANSGGGITGRSTTRGTGSVKFLWMDGLYSGSLQPNRQYIAESGSPVFDSLPLFLYDNEGTDPGVVGYVDPTIVSIMYGAQNNDSNAALTRIYLGAPAGVASTRFSVDWDGATVPGSVATRVGVQS